MIVHTLPPYSRFPPFVIGENHKDMIDGVEVPNTAMSLAAAAVAAAPAAKGKPQPTNYRADRICTHTRTDTRTP